MPFILVLSLTGAAFLFKLQLDRRYERRFQNLPQVGARVAVGTTRRRGGGVAQRYVAAPLLPKSVVIAASCKVVKQNASVACEVPASETYQACKGKSGNWVMKRV